MPTPKWACNCVHDWHNSLWVMLQKGIWSHYKQAHHSSGGWGRGGAHWRWTEPPPPSQISQEQPQSISAAERTHFPKANTICSATHNHTHTHLSSLRGVCKIYNRLTLTFLFIWESTDIFTALIKVKCHLNKIFKNMGKKHVWKCYMLESSLGIICNGKW